MKYNSVFSPLIVCLFHNTGILHASEAEKFGQLIIKMSYTKTFMLLLYFPIVGADICNTRYNLRSLFLTCLLFICFHFSKEKKFIFRSRSVYVYRMYLYLLFYYSEPPVPCSKSICFS